MRKTMAFLLTIVMAAAFVCPALAQTLSQSAEIKSMEPESGTALLADDTVFYGYFQKMSLTRVVEGIGEYNLTTDSGQVYNNSVNLNMFSAEYTTTESGYAIYGVIERTYQTDEAFVRFDSLDDFKAGKYTEVSLAPDRIFTLALDPSTNTMYAMGDSFGKTYRTFYVVEPKLGTFTETFRLEKAATGGSRALLMEIDSKGNMYIVTESGNLYSVDKRSGDAEYIGSTGLKPYTAQQCLSYDNNTESMYWFYLDSGAINGNYGAYTLDLNTAQTVKVGTAATHNIWCAFTIPNEPSAPEPVEPTGISLNETAVTLTGGDRFNLIATIEPVDGYIVDRTVNWTTSDANVVRVSDNGQLYAQHAGTATVTATTKDGKFSAECKVTVNPGEEKYGELSDALNYAEHGSENWILFSTGDDYPWKVEVKDDRTVARSTNARTNSTVSYVENVYPVTLAGGSTILFDYSVSCDTGGVSGFDFYVNGELIQNEEYQFRGRVGWTTYEYTVPKNGEYTFRWEYMKSYALSDDPNDCAWLDNIEFNAMDYEPIEAIALSPDNTTMFRGFTLQLDVVYLPVNARPANITYTSSDESIATVNEKGLVTAHAPGEVTITAATDEGTPHTAQSKITVYDIINVDELDYTQAELGKAYTATLGGQGAPYVNFRGNIKYAVGYVIDIPESTGMKLELAPTASGAVRDPDVYLYDEDFNLVLYNDSPGNGSTTYSRFEYVPKTAGRFYIVVTTYRNYNEDSGNFAMRLSAYEAVHVTGLRLSPETVSMGVGKTVTLHAILTPANNDYPYIEYESSDTSVVTVADGKLYGIAEGTATVTAVTFDGGFKDSITVTVTNDAIPNPEYDGNIYGFVMYSDNLQMGFAKYDPNGSAADLELVSVDENRYYSAVYYDGTIYAYEYENVMTVIVCKYVKLDANTFNVKATYTMHQYIPTDMTIDYNDGTIYASVLDTETNRTFFGTVDMETGEIQYIRYWNLTDGAVIISMEMTPDGTLYGVGSDGWFYEINKANGNAERVYDLGVVTSYVSGLVYDPYTSVMHWFPFTAQEGAQVISFDPISGDTYNVEKLGRGMTEFSAAMILDDRNDTPDPDVKTFTVTFMDFEDQVASRVTVREGGSAKAPEVKHPKGIPFVAWDKAFTDVHEDITVYPLALGDVNGDRAITAGDATMILRDVVGATELTESQRPFADANGNGGTDTADATILLRYVVSDEWGGKK